MYFSNSYNSYYYPNYLIDAVSISANEESLLSDPEDDLTLIVENILNKYLKNNYLEYEKEELYQRLEMIIQDQANFIYQSKIKQQIQNITSFPYYQIDPYSLPIYPFYNSNMLQLTYPNSKRIHKHKNKKQKLKIKKKRHFKKLSENSIE